MKKTVLVIVLLSVLAAAFPLGGQTPAAASERYLDSAPDKDGSVRLAIFNPELFNIRALVELRKLGILDIPNLVVVGVFHTKQADDFAASRKYVADNGLDWFKFHADRGRHQRTGPL